MAKWKKTLDVDVDENGQPVLPNEPQVSKKRGQKDENNQKNRRTR